MSVSTTAYSIDAKTLKKLKHDEDNFAFLFGDCDDDERWETERYDFDTNINFYVSLFRRVGLETVGTNIDSEASELGNYDAYDIWFVPTKTVKKMVVELTAMTPDELKMRADELALSDRHGSSLSRDAVHDFIDQIPAMTKFFKKAAEQENSLVFSEA